MIKYGKTAQNAITIISYLAEKQPDQLLVGSQEVSKVRQLPQPVVAKLLTLLSQAGLLEGTPGPRGGYRLARPASDIFLYDVVSLFEKPDNRLQCPFGPNWCGNGDPCPMHDELEAINHRILNYLKTTSLAIFLYRE